MQYLVQVSLALVYELRPGNEHQGQEAAIRQA